LKIFITLIGVPGDLLVRKQLSVFDNFVQKSDTRGFFHVPVINVPDGSGRAGESRDRTSASTLAG
jgi:hypothetical protein